MILFAFSACLQSDNNSDTLRIHENHIEFQGTIYPKRYNSYSDRQNGHHFIVWSGGRNAKKALINTNVPDAKILDALIQIGAEPGNNLTQETWTERLNPQSEEADQRVQGTPVSIYIQWNQTRLRGHELFKNVNKSDIDIHVGGHRQLIPVWRSGCVTCLFSCPGGKTSNAAYTIRDQAYDQYTFVANTGILPSDGTKVTIIMELSETHEQE